MTRPLSLVLCASLLSLGALGCLPGQIDELSGQASTRVVRPSSVFEFAGFGQVISSTSGFNAEGDHASRIVATAGEDSPFAFFETETAGHVALQRELFHGCATAASGCGAGSGASLAGLESFRDESLCVAMGAPRSGSLHVACESRIGEVETLSAGGGGEASDLGRALASLPDGTSWGVAIAAAPGSGALFVLTSTGALTQLTLPIDVGGEFHGFGNALAASPMPDSAGAGLSGAVLLTVAQRSPARLYLLAAGIDPDTATVQARTLGCVDGLASDVVVTSGDVTGDGLPEIFFSEAEGPTATHSRVRKVSLRDLPRGGGCLDAGVADDPATFEILCPDIDASVACASFGAALAMGDLDADGDQDLLVGAPDSDVNGHRAAGAVYVLPGAPEGFDEVHIRVLADSGPRNDDRLGASLGTVKTRLEATPRDEPVVGAGGAFSADGSTASRFLVFLCSGIPGDSASEVARCLP